MCAVILFGKVKLLTAISVMSEEGEPSKKRCCERPTGIDVPKRVCFCIFIWFNYQNLGRAADNNVIHKKMFCTSVIEVRISKTDVVSFRIRFVICHPFIKPSEGR